MQELKIENNVFLHILPTDKYKHVYTYVNFSSEYNQHQRVVKTILANMLKEASQTYPTKVDFARYLDLLYGASLYTSCRILGNVFNMSVSARVLNRKFTTEDTLKQQFLLLNEIIRKPLLTSKTLAQSQKNVIASINRKKDNPTTYAISQSRKALVENTDYRDTSLISESEIKQVSLNEIQTIYSNMLNKERIDIYVIGDVDVLEVQKACQIFDFESRTISYQATEKYSLLTNLQTIETKKITQTTLVLTYQTGLTYQDENIYTMVAANCLLGQVPTSLLFQEVREANSLCYSIYSSLNSFNCTLTVVTSIDYQNINKVIALIDEQITKLQAQQVSQIELDKAVSLLTDNLVANLDDAEGCFEMELLNTVLNRTISVSEIIQKLKTVKVENISLLMQQVSKKATYILEPEEQNEKNN